MSFINPKAPAMAPAGAPLPPTDNPEVEPRALPPMSQQREQAIAEHCAAGRARGVAHCLFLWRAGILELPA
ncbi:MAG: hypothetical protein AB7I32_01075 [Gammaproteobacteria bacterium]